MLNFLFAYINIMVDDELIADAVQVFAEQSVFIQRTNQILHDLLFFIREYLHVHLFLQLIVEGSCIAINHFLVVGVLRIISVSIVVGHLVIFSDTFQCLIQFVLSFFFFRLCFVGIVSKFIVITVVRIIQSRTVFVALSHECIVRILSFQGRIIIQFGIDIILQFVERHLQHLHQQHLLGGESLELL